MSVLNQSGEEQVECPLCMEPLEVDDLNFFPCTCGYQICRFCWHRIRTDENGLCPACRKAYSENPADFTPLSKEQVAQLKAEKRQRDQQRKAKLSESRKHLANVRVVQKNLVFVVGLPMRLADPEILKRHEYFGKFGKIHKVVINQSTSYAGSQGPSASAYVTYMKSDDALRAIQSVNNIMIDGRLVKSSLGTTKYCSHFMKNQSCPKPDCMYLHDFGDPEASFTKEQMHAGKHQEYEKKLHEVLLAKIAVQGGQQQGDGGNGKSSAKSKDHSTSSSTNNNNTNNNNKEGWPHLNNPQPGDSNTNKGAKTTDKRGDKQGEGTTNNSNSNNGKEKGQKSRGKSKNNNNDSNRKDRGKGCESGGCQGQNERQGRGPGKSRSQERDRHNGRGDENKIKGTDKTNNNSREESVGRDSSASNCSSSSSEKSHTTSESIGVAAKLQIVNENSSFFSQNVFQKLSPVESDHSSSGVVPIDHDVDDEDESNGLLSHNNSRNLLESAGGMPPSSSAVNSSTSHILNDSLPNIDSSEDWEAAFGFSKKNSNNSVNENDEKRRKEMLVGPFGNGGNGYISFLGQQQQQQQQQTLFGGHDSTAASTTLLQNSFDTTKLHESILDVLNNKNHFFSNPYTKTEDRLGAGHPLSHLNSQHSAPHHHHHHQHPNFAPPNGLNGVNGLDQQMSKFFTDFCTKNSQNGLLPNGLSSSSSSSSSATSNGFVGAPQNGLHPHTNNSHHGHNGFLHSLADRHNFLIMQQKQIEEQLLTLKQQQQSYGQQLLQQHNGLGGLPSAPFLNGDVLGGPANAVTNGGGGVFGSMHLYHHHNQPQQHNSSHHNSNSQHHQIGSGNGGGGGKQQNSNNSNRSAEDELDFDPFHETQKALAELIENEQNGKIHGTGSRSSVPTSQINGLVHSQNGSGGGHVPPPPPGFVQPTNHMNSFGSKILPYLNMNSSQHQPINGTTTQNNWPATFNPVQQQKGLGNCNDWKVLDPAIVSSSRHFPLANMHMRDQYTSPLQQPQHVQNGLGGGPMRSFDYASFAGSPQQVQTAASSAFSSFSHLTNSVQQNLNWLAGSADLGTQISSPPGFRTTTAGGPVVGKTQQEC